MTRKTKLSLILLAGAVSISLFLIFFMTHDGRWIFPQFPGFMAAFMMCGKNCTGMDTSVANATWILLSFIQYYAIFRLFGWLYLRIARK